MGFLPHNFNPARIFMGDAGAMLLGLMLAVTTITVGGRTADQFSGQTYFFFAPLLIPILILGVPIVDTAFSFVRRLFRRQSWSTADREHLHHRLMRLGHGPGARWRSSGCGRRCCRPPRWCPPTRTGATRSVPIAIAALALLLYSYFHPGVVEVRRVGRAARDEEPTEEVAVIDERRRPRRRPHRGGRRPRVRVDGRPAASSKGHIRGAPLGVR